MYWEELSGHFDPHDGGALFAREGDGRDRHDYYVAGVFYDYIDGEAKWWATIIAYDNGNVIGEGYVTVEDLDTAIEAFWYGDGCAAESEDLGTYNDMDYAINALRNAVNE